MIRDFLSKIRKRTIGQNATVETLVVVLPSALLLTSSLVGPINLLIKDFPGAVRIARVAVPFVLLIICIKLIMDKELVPSAIVDAAGTSAQSSYRKKYPEAKRFAAKLMVVPVICAFFYQFYDSIPNALTGRTLVTGYMCNVKGEPLENAAIHVLGSVGPSSKDVTTTDDTGFFVAVLAPLAQRPTKVIVNAAGECRDVELAARTSARMTKCPNSSFPPPPRPATSTWRISC